MNFDKNNDMYDHRRKSRELKPYKRQSVTLMFVSTDQYTSS